MNGGIQYILVDGDVRRRAQISRDLLAEGAHVEPFEDVGELIAHWPQSGVVLAHDEGAILAALIEHMTRSGKWLSIVAFASQPTTRQIVRAVQEGIVDYLDWPFVTGELGATVADAIERGKVLSRAKQREAVARSRIGKLSARELEVLSGVTRGLSNELIGRELSISSRTVEIHRARMLNKIGANHTSEAIRIAIEASLLD